MKFNKFRGNTMINFQFKYHRIVTTSDYNFTNMLNTTDTNEIQKFNDRFLE